MAVFATLFSARDGWMRKENCKHAIFHPCELKQMCSHKLCEHL